MQEIHEFFIFWLSIGGGIIFIFALALFILYRHK